MLFASRRGALNLMGGSQEDQVLDIFAEVGTVKNIQMNLDRQTGFVKVRRHVEHRTYRLSRAACSRCAYRSPSIVGDRGML